MKDLTFSKLSLSMAALALLAVFSLAGCGGGGGNGSSENSTITAEAQQVIQNQDTAANFYATAAQNNSDTAITDTVTYLKTFSDVENADVAEDGSTIWVKYKNGVVGHILTQSFASLSNTTTAAKMSSASTLTSAVNYFKASVLGEKKALMLLPLESTSGYSDTAAPSIKKSLELAGYVVDVYTDDKASVEVFKTIKDYDVVYISTHGLVSRNGNIAIGTGEIADANMFEIAWNWLKQGDAGGFVLATADGKTTIALNKNFFKNYSYKSSLVVVNACSSFENTSLSDTFLGMGAGVYLGWDNTSFMTFAGMHFPSFFEGLTKTNTTLQSAYDSTVQQYYPASIYKDDNKNKSWRAVLKNGDNLGDKEDTTLDYMLKFSYAGNGNYIMVPSTSDTTAPTTPTGVSATSTSASQINLSWSASTDAVGVTGYKIYRDGTYLKSITVTLTI